MNFNSYWYLGLSVLSLALLIYVIWKTRTLRCLLLLLAMTEVAYLIETVIYVFLDCYRYYPKLLKHSTYYDSDIGALTSNMLALPIAATCIAAFQLRWMWIVGFTGLFAAIEWLFLSLNIYAHHWWRIEYTAIGLLVFFPLAKIMYRQILRPLHGFLHFVLLFLCIAPIAGTLQILPIMLFSSRYYNPGWFENRDHDTGAFAAVYYVIGSILYALLAKLHLNKGIKLAILLTILIAATVTLQKMKLLSVLAWWDPWYYTLFPLFLLSLAETISIRLANGPPTT